FITSNLVLDRLHAVDIRGTSLQPRLGARFNLCTIEHMAWPVLTQVKENAVQDCYNHRAPTEIRLGVPGWPLPPTRERTPARGAAGTESTCSQLQGEPHEPGHHTVDRSDPVADRRLSSLAAQQQL